MAKETDNGDAKTNDGDAKTNVGAANTKVRAAKTKVIDNIKTTSRYVVLSVFCNLIIYGSEILMIGSTGILAVLQLLNL